MKTQLQKNLEFLMERSGHNPTSLALAAGIQQPTLHRIISGESTEPRASTLKPLADFYKCTVEYLRSADIERIEGEKERKQVEGGAANEAPRNAAKRSTAEPRRSGDGFAKFSREFHSAMWSALSKCPTIKTRVVSNFAGARMYVDVLGDRVCAELKCIPEGAGLALDSFIRNVGERGVSQLVNMRQLHRQENRERSVYILVFAPGASNITSIGANHAMGLAGLHGLVTAFVEKPEDAVNLIIDAEEGRLFSSDEEGEAFDEDDAERLA